MVVRIVIALSWLASLAGCGRPEVVASSAAIGSLEGDEIPEEVLRLDSFEVELEWEPVAGATLYTVRILEGLALESAQLEAELEVEVPRVTFEAPNDGEFLALVVANLDGDEVPMQVWRIIIETSSAEESDWLRMTADVVDAFQVVHLHLDPYEPRKVVVVEGAEPDCASAIADVEGAEDEISLNLAPFAGEEVTACISAVAGDGQQAFIEKPLSVRSRIVGARWASGPIVAGTPTPVRLEAIYEDSATRSLSFGTDPIRVVGVPDSWREVAFEDGGSALEADQGADAELEVSVDGARFALGVSSVEPEDIAGIFLSPSDLPATQRGQFPLWALTSLGPVRLEGGVQVTSGGEHLELAGDEREGLLFSSDRPGEFEVTLHGTNLTATGRVIAPEFDEIVVDTGDELVPAGLSLQPRVYAVSGQERFDVTPWVSWDSPARQILDFDTAGRFHARQSGVSQVVAHLGEWSADLALSVLDTVPSTLTISAGQGRILVGNQKQMVASATLGVEGEVDVTAGVEWHSSNSSVLRVVPSGPFAGLAVAVGEGHADLTASFPGGPSEQIRVDVVNDAPESFAIDGAKRPVLIGRNVRLTAVLADGNAIPGEAFWSVDGSGHAAVVPFGPRGGIIAGISEGQTRVEARFGDESASAVVTVSGRRLESLSGSGTHGSLVVGGEIDIRLVGEYSDGESVDITGDAVWASSNSAILQLGAAGQIEAKGVGKATVTASLEGISWSQNIEVSAEAIPEPTLESVTVSPQDGSVAKGRQFALSATAAFSDGNQRDVSSDAAWTSSQESVAVLNSQGLASAIGVGTTTVAASFGGKSSATSLSVGPAELVSLSLQDVSIAAGFSATLAATGEYSDGSTRTLTGSELQWSTSDGSVATVDANGVASGVAAGGASLTAESGGVSAEALVSVSNATLTSVDLSLPAGALALGLNQQAEVTAQFSDGSSLDAGAAASWASADSNVATVSSSGVVSAVGVGTANLTATVGGQSDTASITVTAAELVSLAVTPSSPSVAKGLTQQLTATGTYTDGSTQDLSGSASWSSADTGVATVSSSGLTTAAGVGSASLTATVGGQSDTASITVTAAELVSLVVTPSSPSVAKGLTQQLTATGTYTDGSTQDLSGSASWSSTDTGVATVSSSGLTTAAGVGSANLTATVGGQSDTASITVTAAELVTLAVTPSSPSVAKGLTQQLTATGTYTDGSTQDLSGSASWSSTDTGVTTVSSSGLTTAAGVGSANLTATVGGQSDTASITVTAAELVSLGVTPSDPTIAKGNSQQMTATGTFTDSSTQDLSSSVSWAVADANIASITSAGLLSADGLGSSTVSATEGGVSGSTSVTVDPPILLSVAISPGSAALTLGGSTQQLALVGTYSDGTTSDLTDSATWTSSGTGVCTVGNVAGVKGLTTAVGLGSASVTGAAGGFDDTITVGVSL